MFWKNAKHGLIKPKSITARLTIFYTLATCSLLIVVALFLYWPMVDILYKTEHQFLVDEIDTVENILQHRPSDKQALAQEVIGVPTALSNSVYDYYIRVFNNKRQLVIATPGMEKLFKGPEFFNKTTVVPDKQSFWLDLKDKNYLLMQSSAQVNNQPWLIQVALDVSYQQAMIRSYRLIMLIVLFFGILAALFLGYIIARRGMQSLRELTESTKKITATSLHKRIDPSSWPNELSSLGLAFNQMLDGIESSFVRLTQFSADLAHELRNPINNLMGETEIALSRAHSVEEYQQVLESNFEELRRISQVIENLLFLARAENPKLEIEKQPIAIHTEIAVVCDYYQALADEKNIKIISAGEAMLAANSIMLRRMLSNILANSLKYTPPGGLIKITLEETAVRVQLTISDSGTGIGPQHLPKIFDRFYRVDSARSQKSGGVGLGLAIVKSIVELHHGKIMMTSKPATGTTLIITFPK